MKPTAAYFPPFRTFWLHPIWICIAWSLVATMSLLVNTEDYRLLMGAAKYIDAEAWLLSLWFLFMLALGSATAIHLMPKGRHRANTLDVWARFLENRQVRWLCLLLFLTCLTAYIIWFLPTFSITAIRKILTGGLLHRRGIGNHIPGVTTLTQLGVFLAVISSLAISMPGRLSRRTRRFYARLLVGVMFLALYRAFIWSERLALVELILPASVVILAFRVRSAWLRQMAPLFGLVAAVALFGIFEYFRSWHYYQRYYDNIALFSFQRFMAYYLSAYNNFAMMLKEMEVSWQPVNILQFFYTVPLPFNPLRSEFLNEHRLELAYYLQRYTNPEFNQFGGAGLIYLDVGAILGSAVLFCFGLISGALYASFRNASAFGTFLYPIWMVGLSDFPRILYWTSGRAFVPLITALLFSLLFRHFLRRFGRPSASSRARFS